MNDPHLTPSETLTPLGVRLIGTMMKGKAIYRFLVFILVVGIVVSPLTAKEEEVNKIQQRRRPMKMKAVAFMLLAMLLTLFTIPVYANGDPPLAIPHAFYGTVEVNGDPAPVGTEVEARGDGVLTGVDGNPVVIIADGKYGNLDDPFELKLFVQGYIAEGATLTFYVSGVATGQTAEWHSGEVTEVNLTATIEGPLPGTTEVSDIISSAGVFSEAVIAESSDSLCQLTIAKDTIGLTGDGEPLSEVKMTRMGAPPAPPAGARVVGSVYDFKPDGATFSPAATLKYTYDPSRIPTGVVENELVLVWWDAGTGKWVETESTVNPEANTITAPVSHFTAFAALAYLPPEPVLDPAAFTLSALVILPGEVALGESVTISIEEINTGEEAGNYTVTLKIDGVVEASKDITVNAGASQEVSFTTVRDLPGGYAVDVNGLGGTFVVGEEAQSPPAPPAPTPPAPTLPVPLPASTSPINWPVLWGVIGGVVVVGLIIFLLARRKAY